MITSQDWVMYQYAPPPPSDPVGSHWFVFYNLPPVYVYNYTTMIVKSKACLLRCVPGWATYCFNNKLSIKTPIYLKKYLPHNFHTVVVSDSVRDCTPFCLNKCLYSLWLLPAFFWISWGINISQTWKAMFHNSFAVLRFLFNFVGGSHLLE